MNQWKKINGRVQAMVKSARSHKTLELITVENGRTEALEDELPHYFPLIGHFGVLIN